MFKVGDDNKIWNKSSKYVLTLNLTLNRPGKWVVNPCIALKYVTDAGIVINPCNSYQIWPNSTGLLLFKTLGVMCQI